MLRRKGSKARHGGFFFYRFCIFREGRVWLGDMLVHVCGGPVGGQLRVFYLSTWIEIQGLLFTIVCACLASWHVNIWRCCCFCVPSCCMSARITDLGYCAQLYSRFWGSNSDPYICLASTFTTEPISPALDKGTWESLAYE